MATPNNDALDGFTSLIGGMHGGIDPSLIAETYYARGLNVTCRDGVIQTRPAFTRVAALATGTFQGACKWSLNSKDRLVYVVAGHLYSWDPDTLTSTDHGLRFNPTVIRCSFVQVDKWFLVQDGTSTPTVLQENADGSVGLYSETNPAQPAITPGTALAFVHGRIHYAPTTQPALTPVVGETDESKNAAPDTTTLSGRASFVSSDILDLYDPQFVFRMSEHRILNLGGAIGLPQELGFISAMAPFRNSATGSGVGAMVIFGREGVCAFDVSASRDQWGVTNLSQVLFYGSGTISPMSVVPLNDDLLYVDTEGNMRTVRYAKSQIGGNTGALSNTAMSTELRPLINQRAEESLSAVSSCVADNRCLFTLAGTADGFYRGVGVLDVAKFASLSGAQEPGYDGVWTGFTFKQVLSARIAQRMETFAIVSGATPDANILMKLTANVVKDLTTTPIQSTLWTRVMTFGSPMVLKSLTLAELWLSGIECDTTVSVYYRPKGYEKWSLAATRTIKVPDGSYPQVRRQLHFPINIREAGCDPATGEKLFLANEFQFAIVWTGRCKIDRFIATATKVPSAPAACAVESGVSVDDTSAGVVLSDFDYSVDTGG